ncbi:hypothetical protein PFAS1_16030 [Pseudomonas frederiksbergensis]|nr:hypothetical protein PFAS1_16030 [Pseudomonas frederiksbergensis]
MQNGEVGSGRITAVSSVMTAETKSEFQHHAENGDRDEKHNDLVQAPVHRVVSLRLALALTVGENREVWGLTALWTGSTFLEA